MPRDLAGVSRNKDLRGSGSIWSPLTLQNELLLFLLPCRKGNMAVMCCSTLTRTACRMKSGIRGGRAKVRQPEGGKKRESVREVRNPVLYPSLAMPSAERHKLCNTVTISYGRISRTRPYPEMRKCSYDSPPHP